MFPDVRALTVPASSKVNKALGVLKVAEVTTESFHLS